MSASDSRDLGAMRLSFFAAALFVLFAVPARADVFKWEHPESGLTLTYPDTWAVLTQVEPDTIFRVQAPSTTDEAECRVRVRPENRFLIYPPRYDPAVQKVAYSADFWKDYLFGRYEDIMIHNVSDQAGFGRGYASYMLATYTTLGDDPALRSALGFASAYNDKAYILECSSLAGAFENWAGMFQSIAKSVDFRKAYHESASGNYRNFLNE